MSGLFGIPNFGGSTSSGGGSGGLGGLINQAENAFGNITNKVKSTLDGPLMWLAVGGGVVVLIILIK